MIELSDMIGCFLNYISKMGENFLTASDVFGIPFTELLLEMIRNLGTGCLESCSDTDLCLSLRLLIGLIENLKGKIDEILPIILDISTELMKQNRTDGLKRALLQVVCMMFWYNPSLTMNLLNDRGITEDLFKAWFGNVDQLRSDYELERELYGIAGLLTLPNALFPKVSQTSKENSS